MTEMRIQLSSLLIVQIYRASREAERSVDALLIADWLHFHEYYDADRISFIQRLVQNLEKQLGSDQNRACMSIETIGRRLSWRRFLPVFLARVLSRGKLFWHFPRREVRFFICAMQSMVELLERTAKPTLNDISSLRRALYVCQLLIEARCHGMVELKQIGVVEHFSQPGSEFLKSLREPKREELDFHLNKPNAS